MDVIKHDRLGAHYPVRLPSETFARASLQPSTLSMDLALVALAVAMLARVLTAAGAPALVNFLHFPVTLGAALLVAPRVRRRASKQLLAGIYLLLAVILVSAFINDAGLINALLDFLLFSEPFLFLFLLTGTAMTSKDLARLRFIVTGIALIHALLAYHQHYGLGLRGDDVEGLFVAQGAGAHVAGAVALSAAVYFAMALPSPPLTRVILALVCAPVVVLSDSKQVVVVFVASLAVLAILQAKATRLIRYGALTAFVCLILFIAAHTFFPALAGRANPDQITEGLRQKGSIFPLLTSHFSSPTNWLIGLGPGHTVGRLGGLIPKYHAYLDPLGATTSSIPREARKARDSHWLSSVMGGSSLWSPFFFWAGCFGDLGLLGVGVLVTLWALVWRSFCRGDLARFFALNVFFFGATFSWLEEPGYMMFVAALIVLLRQHRSGQLEFVPVRQRETRVWARTRSFTR